MEDYIDPPGNVEDDDYYRACKEAKEEADFRAGWDAAYPERGDK